MTADPVRHTHLRKMRLSPAHYAASVQHRFESTPYQRVGLGCHALVLGGNFQVWHGKRAEKGYKEFAEQHADELILNESEYLKASACAESVMAHHEARELLIEGDKEKPLGWEFLGRACRGTLDLACHKDRIVELKTCNSAEPERFRRSAFQMAYDAQLSWYLEGANQNGYDIPSTDTPQNILQKRGLFIVAVETQEPYVVTVFRLTERVIEESMRKNRLWMEQLLVCEQTDLWPPYATEILPFDVLESFGLIGLEDESLEEGVPA